MCIIFDTFGKRNDRLDGMHCHSLEAMALLVLESDPMSDQPKPIAWAFYWPDGRLRFIVEGEERAAAWAKAHQGKVVPLVPQKEDK